MTKKKNKDLEEIYYPVPANFATNEYSKNLSMMESVNYNLNQGQINNIKVFEKDKVNEVHGFG